MKYADIQRLIKRWEKAEEMNDTVRAALLRELVNDALAGTIPVDAERSVEYLNYLQDTGCLTYDAWLGLVEEHERENTPISTTDSPEPF